MSAMIPFFSSCSDDDSVNEWDMSYVSLLPADYLRPTPSFTLKHVEEEGIEGSVEFQFMATTQKAVTQDINVHYSVTCDGIDANKINLSAKNLLIKAGSTASEPITLSITDWKYLENTKEALEYTLKIKIADIESTSAEVTNAAYYQEIVLKISKTAEKKKESVLLTNVTGVQTTHWGAGYAPSKVEIFSSENGDDWVSIGQWDTKGRTQTITFDERVKTRYLKYQMITVPSRVDITRFYIYAW